MKFGKRVTTYLFEMSVTEQKESFLLPVRQVLSEISAWYLHDKVKPSSLLRKKDRMTCIS